MRNTGAKRHIHKYHRLDGLWHCALSNCTHYMPYNVAANLPGKESICWGCGESFKLDTNTMKNDQPHCIKCLPQGFDWNAYMEEQRKKKLEEIVK